MSDHGENVSEMGFKAPVPELDDHRHQSSSSQQPERVRRGTFDTLYGARLLGSDVDHRDLLDREMSAEEAIVDDDVISPVSRRSRRPTFESMAEQRDASPPNSVKAFAEARRRERQMSVSDPKMADRKADPGQLYRTTSTNSRASIGSKTHTVEADVASLASKKTAEDDVCFPVQESHKKDQLHIDFDYLENFIRSERSDRDCRVPSNTNAEGKAFSDMRLGSSEAGPGPVQVTTLDGDILDMPSDASTANGDLKEKGEQNLANVARQQPHTEKNRFSFFSSAWESTIHAPDFDDLILPGEDIRGLFTLPEDDTDGVWWLNVNEPTKEEVAAICKSFGVHPLTIEDITTQEAREKIELFPSYYFACFRSFHIVEEEDGPEYEPFNIYAVVFREGTLSFSFQPNSHASHVRKRIALLKDYVALSSDWICYALIDDIVDGFAPVIRKLELEADAIEDSVFTVREDDSNDFLRSIGRCRKNSMALIRLLGGKADVLRGFTKRCNENYKVTPRMDIGMYLGDIQDHVVTMVTNLGHFEKILSRSHSNYLAQLQIDNIQQGTNTNVVLGKITFWATILVPMNLVSGLFGMNVQVPFQEDSYDTLAPFFTIFGCMILFSLLVILMGRKMKYI